MIGGIGGTAEEEAAEFVKRSRAKKPMIGFISGVTAPPGKRMGHPASSPAARARPIEQEAMRSAGIPVADSPSALGSTMVRAIRA